MARAQEQAKVGKLKIVSHSATKTHNTKNMETTAGKRKSTRIEVSMTEDSPCRKRIRSEVRDAKIKQAEQASRIQNKKIIKHARKDPLEVGDLCTVSTQGLKKLYFPYLPVIITTVTNKGETKRYSVATKQGPIRGTHRRCDLPYRKNYNGEILGFSVDKPGFKKNYRFKRHAMT